MVSLLRTTALDTVAVNKDGFIHGLYQQHRTELCRYLVHKTRLNAVEAEDVVQSAFARFSAIDSPQTVQNPRAYLYKVAMNLAIDHQRRHQVQDNYMQAVVDDQASASAPGPEQVVDGRQRLGILSRALWCMPKKRRQLLLMSRFDGLSFAEIGRQVGLSESVVRKHISNALADCHKALHARDSAGASHQESVKQVRN